MPTYHYRCSECEQHLEVVQSMTDDPITECGACGGEMHKVLQPVGIVLKGSGFYRTDNRGSSKKSSGSDSSEKSTSSDSKTSKDSKSDSSSSSSSSDSKSSKSSGTSDSAKAGAKSA